MPPGSLGKVLEKLGPHSHKDLLAGSAGCEDAGVFRLDAERALVQTLDFFPPIVDDPRWFGRIAAANSLSDVYAMGGRPLTALNIVAWPKDLDVEILAEVLIGGLEKVEEAGAALCGGHSIADPVILYGLSVTGMVHPERFWKNSGARPGDHLLLTKPLGIGIVSSAMKKGKASAETTTTALAQMAALNREASEAMAGLTVHAATDVTGFGIMGHGFEMAEGSGLTLRLRSQDLPLFDRALQYAREGHLSGGAKRGMQNLEGRYASGSDVDPSLLSLMFDAETSGGLMLAVPEAEVELATRRLVDAGALTAAVVGSFEARGEVGLVVD